MKHLLEADGIQLQFRDRPILSGIYIKCETGKISGLLGRNGQGKSCLMKIIYGTLRCEKSVRIDRKAQPEGYKRPDLLQFLPQFNFIPRTLSLKRVFKDYSMDFSKFEELFPEFASKYKSTLGSLSGGGHRLIELYIIVKSTSSFAMLDEPFTHLSPLQIEKVKELILEEKKHKGFLVTDHLYKHVLEISDDVYVLANGHIYLVKDLEDVQMLGYAGM